MYTLLFILLAALAAFCIYRGVNFRRPLVVYLGVLIGIATLFLSWFLNFWSEKLWFDQMGYNDRFWTVWISKLGLFLVPFAGGGLIVYLLTFSREKMTTPVRLIASLAGALGSGLWWADRWELFLKFTNRMDTGMVEPILNRDTGFYLFSYPFLDALYVNLLILALISLGAAILNYRYTLIRNSEQGVASSPEHLPATIYLSLGAFLMVLGFGRYVARYGMLFSDYGFVSGAGWTDVHVRLPMLMVTALFTFLTGIGLLFSAIKPGVKKLWRASSRGSETRYLYTVTGLVAVIWVILLWAVPVLFQWLKVEPNEITLERPYLEHNIKFTRAGFDLEKTEKNEFQASGQLDQQTLDAYPQLLSNIRLWDYRALDAVFKQFQEIRLYYEFHDVDIDRYTLRNQYRQVMVSAREMQPENLPLNSQTFVNQHFKYTHGYGAVLNLVNEFTEDGLPNLLIKDIPPVSDIPSLKITRPEVYYGEITNHYVVANSSEKEFDYPSGEDNIYAHYEGSGGVEISNLWRKFLFGYNYGGTRFLLSSYSTGQSRIMFHRNITDRVRTLAPFLQYDHDPYIVISGGRMYWIIDAYTTSRFFPYSEPFSTFENATGAEKVTGGWLHERNYIRNAVKVVIDAYNGATDFYIFDQDDPLAQVYDRIFPGLFKSEDQMPESLRKHVRYPVDMLLLQGLVYAKYHMTDPTVFYNQEDLWVRATEKYYGSVQPVEPYYIMWQPPGSDEMEFVLMLPFTPKDKQVMIGWIAGMCDQQNYGRLLAYQFPKEKRILGTQQVETKIDQDSYLSGQLTLWDQRGSNVIRGNVLAIPVGKTILYVEPIYLQSETSAYPELRLVAVMHDDHLSYAETFDEALRKLVSGTGSEAMIEETSEAGMGDMGSQINRAKEAFDRYLESMQQKNFGEAGRSLEELENALEQLITLNNES